MAIMFIEETAEEIKVEVTPDFCFSTAAKILTTSNERQEALMLAAAWRELGESVSQSFGLLGPPKKSK